MRMLRRTSGRKGTSSSSVMCRVPIWMYLLLFSVSILALSEIGLFVWTLKQCGNRITSRSSSVESSVFAAVADVHVLGKERSTLDQGWTDYQTRKSMWLLKHLIHLDGLLALGDYLDQIGDYPSTREEWKRYFERYEWIMNDFKGVSVGSKIPLKTVVIDSVIGNHDAQFVHLATSPSPMMDWFQQDVGPLNGFQRIEELGVEFIWINAMALFYISPSSSSGVDDRPSNAYHDEVMRFLKEEIPPKSPRFTRILLSHVPSYRVDDLACDEERLQERGHVTYFAPEEPLRIGFDVFNKETSRSLLHSVDPDVMLSGHLHSQCITTSRYEADGINKSFLEISVPSLCYRMRPDPGFALIKVPKRAVKTEQVAEVLMCKLPHEPTVIVLDIVGGIGMACSVIWALFTRWRARGESSATKPKAM